jgi:cofilin
MLGLSSDLTEIVVLDTSAEADYGKFVEALPADECRIAVYDFVFGAEDGGERRKILLILWTPDAARLKAKLFLTTSLDGLRRKLAGIGTVIKATDLAELSYEAVLDKAKRK